MTSGFFSGSEAWETEVVLTEGACSLLGVVGLELLLLLSGTASRAGVSRSFVDLEGASDSFLRSVPGVGAEANSLYELSVMRGIFHGNLRNDIQQKMMASDQISAG